jgi:hypothetical protein
LGRRREEKQSAAEMVMYGCRVLTRRNGVGGSMGRLDGARETERGPAEEADWRCRAALLSKNGGAPDDDLKSLHLLVVWWVEKQKKRSAFSAAAASPAGKGASKKRTQTEEGPSARSGAAGENKTREIKKKKSKSFLTFFFERILKVLLSRPTAGDSKRWALVVEGVAEVVRRRKKGPAFLKRGEGGRAALRERQGGSAGEKRELGLDGCV